jgi:hypothetical protein
MNAREDMAGLGKPFAHRLSVMIQARLLTYREFVPWADSNIESLERPPSWILDLSLTKQYSEAATIVRHFAYSDPAQDGITWDSWVDDFVASQYLRYHRREISWATFLEFAGREADNNGGRHTCEYFYHLLNEYERAGFAENVEQEQRAEIALDYATVVDSVQRVFDGIAMFRHDG